MDGLDDQARDDRRTTPIIVKRLQALNLTELLIIAGLVLVELNRCG